MKLLVIGSGGREHAIAKKLKKSPKVHSVYCLPGNPGMKRDGIETAAIEQDDHKSLIEFAKNHKVAWTIIGPEVPLFNGLADAFEAEGLKVFGPSQAATQIEASKRFAKQLMTQQRIPTADYQTFTDYETAKAYLAEQGAPIVIKADGLAAGKGVVVAETAAEAQTALKEMMQDNKFGDSSASVVIEECLIGEEFSLMAFVNGDQIYPMPISQDHKRLLEQDKGPNTGGMGAYAPVRHIPEATVDAAIEKILVPAAKGMSAKGAPFKGILYAGIIATDEGPKTIEFNARFGDPETQVVLNRLESDLAEVITSVLEGKEPELKWKQEGIDLGVVVAAKGYPEAYEKEIPLDLTASESVELFFAGVTERNQQLVSNGGRIYLAAAAGETIEAAQSLIYDWLNQNDKQQLIYRKDIGDKAKQKNCK
ncbi:phosphoribosylamine--glycine ligase [Marinilactibacillus piezotolerans]|uniref:phosphoribosylamine--glycine ligase n=1 Tax=Marinilactibacillus piezotolerans TaxID=258723 RepID=UPI0009B0B93E|nr:phosphoribosylamine--glycine ligase [Marinilactibacillus piezotolerans]